MNKIGKYTLYLLVVAAFLWALNIYLKPISHAKVLLNSSGEVENKIEDNFLYRDLNKNGKLEFGRSNSFRLAHSHPGGENEKDIQCHSDKFPGSIASGSLS